MTPASNRKLAPPLRNKEDWQIALEIGACLGYPEIFINPDLDYFAD